MESIHARAARRERSESLQVRTSQIPIIPETTLISSCLDSRARSLQGRDICICYGFYMFSVRDNEQVLGVILEDLASTADDLGVYQVLMKKRGENTAEMVESIVSRAFPCEN